MNELLDWWWQRLEHVPPDAKPLLRELLTAISPAIRTLAQPAAAGEAVEGVVQYRASLWPGRGWGEWKTVTGSDAMVASEKAKYRPDLYAVRPLYTHPLPASAGGAELEEWGDADRFAWLGEDHADPSEREAVKRVASHIGTCSLSSLRLNIDANLAECMKARMLAAIDAAMNPDAATTGADAKEGM